MIELRSYQHKGENDIRDGFRNGYRSLLYQLATGGGKTTIFSSIAHSAERRSRRVLIICHRIELVDQIVDRLKEFDIDPQVIAASYSRRGSAHESRHHLIAVASVQTLIKRLSTYPPPDLVICDEAHHCVGGNMWAQVLAAYPEARVLGVTATPCRLDGRGLGAHFQLLLRGPSEAELIRDGYLVRTRIFAPKLINTDGLHIRMGDYISSEANARVDRPEVIGDAFAHYMQHTPNEQGLVFCTSVENADHVAARFRAGGVPALALNGGTDKTLRRMVNQDFKTGKIRVLASCDLFSEGYDVPGASVGIMLRPTKSLALYRQQKGRTMRPAEGKQFATLIDCVRNCENPGFELLTGELDDWQLGEDAERKQRKKPPGVKICPKCFASSSPQASKCSNPGPPPCDHVWRPDGRAIRNRDGEVEEVTPEEIARRRARRAHAYEQSQARTAEELAAIFKRRGYKGDLLGRARRVLHARFRKQLKVTT
jgi:superfamily II DNA or RNA helicase